MKGICMSISNFQLKGTRYICFVENCKKIKDVSVTLIGELYGIGSGFILFKKTIG